jgi:uncharacterized membrane protein
MIMTTGPQIPEDAPQVSPAGDGRQAELRLRRWRIAFYASLAVNLLFLGVVGGAILKGPPPRMGGGDPGLGAYAEALDDEDRKALRMAFRSRESSVRSVRLAITEHQNAVIAALRARPFQPEALDMTLQRQHATIAEQIAIGQQMLRDRLVAMTDDQRAAFADRLERSQKRRRDDHHHGGPGKP